MTHNYQYYHSLLSIAEQLDTPKETYVRIAIDCARSVLHLVPVGEKRPSRAINAAEKWLAKPTESNRRAAAYAASAAFAAAAAYAADAAAAAYAAAAYAAAYAAAAYAAAAYAAADAVADPKDIDAIIYRHIPRLKTLVIFS